MASFAKFREMQKTILRNYFRENGSKLSQNRSEAKNSSFWRFSGAKSSFFWRFSTWEMEFWALFETLFVIIYMGIAPGRNRLDWNQKSKQFTDTLRAKLNQILDETVTASKKLSFQPLSKKKLTFFKVVEEIKKEKKNRICYTWFCKASNFFTIF